MCRHLERAAAWCVIKGVCAEAGEREKRERESEQARAREGRKITTTANDTFFHASLSAADLEACVPGGPARDGGPPTAVPAACSRAAGVLEACMERAAAVSAGEGGGVE